MFPFVEIYNILQSERGIYMAILTACLSLFGVFVGITFQKYMNDREKRFEAYVEVLEAIAESTVPEKRGIATEKFILAKQKVIIYGSESVINALSNIPAFNAKDLQQYENYLDMILLMRKETFLYPCRKNISREVLRKLLG